MVGKKIGKDNVYIHSSAERELPPHLFKRVEDAADKVVEELKKRYAMSDVRQYNFIITHPDYIEFVEAENFDTTFEPVLGKRWRVDAHDNVIFIPRPAKPRILHQRYKTVKPDYKGFDIEEDRKREEWYRSHFDAKRMAGAGFLHKWKEMLAEITPDPDADEFECEMCHGIFDIDESVSIAKGTLVCEECATGDDGFVFINEYECPECGHEWTTTYELACDDKCPKCNLGSPPKNSEEIDANKA